MKVKYRTIHLFSLCWLSVSIMIFLLAWCHWYIAILLVVAMCYILKRFHTSLDTESSIEMSRKKLVLAMITIIAMMVLCGIGGYVVQPNDHYYRNSWFIDMINYDWPIYNTKENLYMCYYFTFWLVPALVGKICNSIDIGFCAQLIWISIGFYLLFLEMCIYIGKTKLGALLIFYCFAGWKIVECLLYFPIFGGNTFRNTIMTLAINGSPGIFHAGPIVQLLYDPFNQTIPLFLSMMLILNNRKSKYIPFVYSIVLYYAPFPFIGLAPIVLYLFIQNTNWHSIWTWVKSWFSFSNIIALILILLIGLFYMANINASHQGLRSTSNIIADSYSFILYMIFEFGIFIVIGYSVCEDKRLLLVAVISVCVLGWFQIGEHNDFCFRSNMPLIFIICLLVIKRYYSMSKNNKIRKIIIACILIGAIPSQIHPTLRYISTGLIIANIDQSSLNKYQSFYDVNNMWVMQQKVIRNDDFGSIFEKPKGFDWTVNSLKASPDSFFFKYLAK